MKVISSATDAFITDTLILPSVGAAGSTIDSLKELGLAGPIRIYIAEGRPFLGICIGL
jgi:imidazoleglycerol phosphate synthase glutamine amidotransferase subunit HisH